MSDQDELLDELESLTARQLALARAGRIEGMEALIRRADELAGRLGSVKPIDNECASQIERIGQLHRQLRLALAARKQELSARLERMQRGKKVLGTYGSGSTR